MKLKYLVVFGWFIGWWLLFENIPWFLSITLYFHKSDLGVRWGCLLYPLLVRNALVCCCENGVDLLPPGGDNWPVVVVVAGRDFWSSHEQPSKQRFYYEIKSLAPLLWRPRATLNHPLHSLHSGGFSGDSIIIWSGHVVREETIVRRGNRI